MPGQIIEDGSRLDGLETVERLRVIAEIERLAAGLRVGADQGMDGLGYEVAWILDLGGHLGVADIAAIARCANFVRAAELLAIADVEGPQTLEQSLHGLGQGFVG